jgi:hypothetical protein
MDDVSDSDYNEAEFIENYLQLVDQKLLDDGSNCAIINHTLYTDSALYD